MTEYLIRRSSDLAVVASVADNEKIAKVIAENLSLNGIKHEVGTMAKNMMSGFEFFRALNTPLCCDPSSETYWSM